MIESKIEREEDRKREIVERGGARESERLNCCCVEALDNAMLVRLSERERGREREKERERRRSREIERERGRERKQAREGWKGRGIDTGCAREQMLRGRVVNTQCFWFRD